MVFRPSTFVFRSWLAFQVIVGLSCSGWAQLLTADNVPISLATGTVVTVEGATRLNTGANISNQGTLRILGDWTNNSGGSGFSSTSVGTVELYGILPQGIGGSAVTDFRNLRLSGGPKQLLQNVVVGLPTTPNGSLDLGVGSVLLLENQTFSVFNPAATAVIDNGGWVASESLNSRFQWALGADISEHRVPFGTPSGPAFPFAYTPNAPLPANTLLSVATYQTAPNNTAYPVTPNQQVLHMAGTTTADNSDRTVDRFWLVDLPNGTFSGDLLLSHTAAEDPLFGPGPIRGQRWLESTGTWQGPSAGQTNPTLRQVRIPAVNLSDLLAPTNEHIWALAYEDAPLPIRLLSFGAEPINEEHVACTWTTASEQQNDYFTVERSKDGHLFEDVGSVDGAGNSNSTLHYGLNDLRPFSGLSYYRLRQTDFDGTTTWSHAVPVVLSPPVQITVYPNPNDGRFSIQRSQSDFEQRFELQDGAGRTIGTWSMGAGVDRLSVEPSISSGIYVIRWEGGQQKVSVGR